MNLGRYLKVKSKIVDSKLELNQVALELEAMEPEELLDYLDNFNKTKSKDEVRFTDCVMSLRDGTLSNFDFILSEESDVASIKDEDSEVETNISLFEILNALIS